MYVIWMGEAIYFLNAKCSISTYEHCKSWKNVIWDWHIIRVSQN